MEEMPCSTRRYPFVGFQPERELGKDVLHREGRLHDRRRREAAGQSVTSRVNRGDKIAFVGENELAQTALFKILMGELEPDEGSVKWGVSTIAQLFPQGQLRLL